MIHEGGRAQAAVLLELWAVGYFGVHKGVSTLGGGGLSSGGWVKNAHAFSLCLGGTFNFILLLNLIRKENKEL